MSEVDINPRFPHFISITREVVDISVNPPTLIIEDVLSGQGRNFLSRSGGSKMSVGVLISDYTISMARNNVDIHQGDLVTAVMTTGAIIHGVVVNSYNGNLGCQIWHNKTSN